MHALAAATVSAVGVALAAVGCHDAPACHGGDWIACRCDGGRRGFAPCDAEAEAFGDCRCDGVPGMTDPGEDGEAGALYTACEQDADCDSGLCYSFNARGPHCTQACEDADDCPPPSSGCNGKGVCKIE
jgi:hypothetical protein